MQNKNILCVGAGFACATIARILAESGYKVVVIDKRHHIGGNAYDYDNKYGIRIHKYGPHLFHTNNKFVVDWLSQFGEWIDYKHKVKAILSDGTYVTLPINKKTTEVVGKDNLIDTFIRPYTKKMWGMDIEELDPSVLTRVPIRDDDNEYYFPNDDYQMLPKNGYTSIFESIFNHENISVKLNTRYNKSMESEYDFIFNSMPIDEYFNFCHGNLPYRSIKFHNVSIPSPKILPVGTVNYTHSGKYTRMTEWKNFPNHGINNEFTTITYEEPCDYKDNDLERYYPVKDKLGINREIYNKYKSMIQNNMQFVGRNGGYVYLDIHQAISSSMSVAKKFLDLNK